MRPDMSNRLDPAFDPRIAEWLETDPDRAPGEVLDTILAALPSVPQRRARRVPWRLPLMLTPTRTVIAAVLGVLLIGGAMLTFRPGQSNVGGSERSPSVAPSPSPMTFAAFGSARDKICRDSVLATDPLQRRFLGTFDSSVSDAARLDWSAALESFARAYDQMIASLTLLVPPPELAADHAADIADFREEQRLIEQVAAALRASDWAAAEHADGATDPLGRRIAGREGRHAFIACP